MKQWFFKITDYADELLDGLSDIDWPTKIKTMQRNWIGRSQGAEIDFKVDGDGQLIRVFTTRPDTLFGATFLVLAPEHDLVKELTTDEQRSTVEEYCRQAIRKSEIERQGDHERQVSLRAVTLLIRPRALRCQSGWQTMFWLATAMVQFMAVPAHDQRDYDFAKKYDLSIIKVIDPTEDVDDDDVIDFYAGEGKLINSGDFDGISTSDAREQVVAWLEEQGIGHGKVYLQNA